MWRWMLEDVEVSEGSSSGIATCTAADAPRCEQALLGACPSKLYFNQLHQ